MENEQKKPNRKLKIAFFALLAVFVLLGAGCFCVVKTALNNIYAGKVDIVSAPIGGLAQLALPLPTTDPFAEAVRTDIDYYETGEIQPVPIYEQKKIDKYIYTILVVVQNGSTASEERQTDMIFLVSYNQLQFKFTVVSVPRDMLVQVEGYGWKRINAAYTLGGIGLLMNTINNSFGLDIQDYVYIGTEELKALADGVNGIPTELTEGEAAYLNALLGCELSAGRQQLTGEQAVAHLLDRSSDDKGDLGRAEAQLRVVENAFFYLQDSFESDYLYPFMLLVFQGIRTNFDFETLMDLGHEVCVAPELTFQSVRLPYADSYTEIVFDGSYGILPEFEKNRILLMQDLYGKES